MNRILTVDDHAPFREALRQFLSREPDFQIVGEAGSVREAIYCVATLSPHLVLTELKLPGTCGADAVTEIKRRHPEVKILVLSIHREEEYRHRCLSAGADGYVVKDAVFMELCASIRAALGTAPGAVLAADTAREDMPGSAALSERRGRFVLH